MRRHLGFGLSFLFVAAIYGCVGDDPVAGGSTPANEAGSPEGGSATEGGPAATDGAVGTDASSCVPGCSDANTLRSCGPQQDLACALGCSTTGTPHCAVLQPRSPVEVADLSAAGTQDLVIGTTLFIDTDSGAIDGVRAANVAATTAEVISGIGFRLTASKVGVFTVKSLAINDTISVMVRGKAALAIVAAGSITIQGILDARGYDAGGVICDAASTTANTAVGPGGNPGSNSGGSNAIGAGGGHGGSIGGGGGGGFGGAGGDGGHSAGDSFAGASVGGSAVATPTSLSGGFGGAFGGNAPGGGGGGAVQLVAGTEIKIGGGAATGGINVGGCGGVGGPSSSGGGGGGAGGAILLQSAKVTMLTNGVLAANGGAGGSGGGRGPAGQLSAQPAAPLPLGGAGKGAGGAGSGGATVTGSAGSACAVNPGSCFAGGGGGGAGFVRVESVSGTLPLPASSLVSPSVGTGATSVAVVSAK